MSLIVLMNLSSLMNQIILAVVVPIVVLHAQVPVKAHALIAVLEIALELV